MLSILYFIQLLILYRCNTKGFSDDLANIFGETNYDNLFNFSFLPSLYLREDFQNFVYRHDNENKENEHKRVMKQMELQKNLKKLLDIKLKILPNF